MDESTTLPTAAQLRDLSDIAATLGAGGHHFRVVCADGQIFEARHLRPRYDHLVLTGRRGPAIEIALSSVVRLEWRYLRLGRAFALGLAIAVAGSLAGALLMPRLSPGGDARGGAFLGCILGALLAPFVVWLSQDLPVLQQWHVWHTMRAV